ncbi:hypothetical protein F0562_001873 [Nyssa sinensis]|uniref:Uncharacterized protein n=1 Tax=Nyssa sinensis TaxID=561372 RepID=A0A5J5C4W6_9ASTE|nr:hypothetical protein F0562_001873 [Nyssa sinensis]
MGTKALLDWAAGLGLSLNCWALRWWVGPGSLVGSLVEAVALVLRAHRHFVRPEVVDSELGEVAVGFELVAAAAGLELVAVAAGSKRAARVVESVLLKLADSKLNLPQFGSESRSSVS